ncbi:hypothetical protein [Roseofilum casamattae]|uniref:Uncharacterized protein n=1 Tax=Roseofilum casamattae BLCC-M143 TaxID=3022442 RepID=A0ABT7BRR0_9CYAN|nr:hypothetical protein [Roseofilum casamattae]MDJ1181875.1 hypothetical protein [Roseofilum casamattae BLCC-M143]
MQSKLNIHPISIILLLAIASTICFLIPVDPPVVEANESSKPLSYLALRR